MKPKIKAMLKVLALIVTIGLGAGPIFAQDAPFNPISGGTFHPISILNATINDVPLEPEDWVGLIDENGRTEAGEDGQVEVAAAPWQANLSLSAVISVRPPVPGAEPSAGAKEGNNLVFMIYDASSDQILPATAVIPDGFGPDVYTIGVLTIVQELQATADISNNPPTAEDDIAETDEDTPIMVDALANDRDPDGDSLSVDSVDTTGTVGSVTDNGDGTFGYDPNGQFEDLNDGDQATDSFSYTISDGNGGTDSATVTITINGVTDQVDNMPPVAEDDDAETDEDNSVTVDALANDSDADGDSLSVDSVDATGTVGSVTDNGDGTFDYDPNGQFEDLNDGGQATDSFSYTISDGNGGTDSATVTITINGVTDMVGEDPFNPISGGTFHPISILNATINDEELAPEDWVGVIDENGRTEAGETGEVVVAAGQWEANLSLSAVISVRPPVPGAEPSAGANEGNDIQFVIYDASTDRFLPATADIPDGFGPDTFTIGVLTIVQELKATSIIGSDPTAEDDAAETDEDTPVTVDVLANDSDPDGDSLSVDSVDTTGTAGTVTDNGDGTITYDPNGQFEALNDGDQATDSFAYTVSDGNGGTDTATVTITINGITDDSENTPPEAADDEAETNEDDDVTVDVLANDSDADGDALSVESVDTANTAGAVTDNGDGTLTYDPNGQFEDLNDGDQETDSFGYIVSDGNGGTATGIVSITINGITDGDNNPPSIATVFVIADPEPVSENSTLIAFPIGASDPDGDEVTILYQWNNGGNDIADATESTLENEDGVLFAEGDEITVVATPFDGTDEGEPVESSPIIIGPPVPSAIWEVTPEMVNFGDVSVSLPEGGEPCQLAVQLQNAGNQDQTVDAISTDNPDFDFELLAELGQVVEPDEVVTIFVSVTPTAATAVGEVMGNMTIETSSGPVIVPLKVNGSEASNQLVLESVVTDNIEAGALVEVPILFNSDTDLLLLDMTFKIDPAFEFFDLFVNTDRAPGDVIVQHPRKQALRITISDFLDPAIEQGTGALAFVLVQAVHEIDHGVFPLVFEPESIDAVDTSLNSVDIAAKNGQIIVIPVPECIVGLVKLDVDEDGVVGFRDIVFTFRRLFGHPTLPEGVVLPDGITEDDINANIDLLLTIACDEIAPLDVDLNGEVDFRDIVFTFRRLFGHPTLPDGAILPDGVTVEDVNERIDLIIDLDLFKPL